MQTEIKDPKPVNAQNSEEAIKAFREVASPFYIVEHDNGAYSLCLPFTFCDDAITGNCQKAFDAYAESIGIPAVNKYGIHAFGSGYDWEEVFRQAFQNDSKLQEVRFDSEAGGFFCNADDLEVLTDLGTRFCEICKNQEQFASFVPAAMLMAEKRQAWEKVNLSAYASVREFLQKNPAANLMLVATEGFVKLTPKDVRRMLLDETSAVYIGDRAVSAQWILDQKLGRSERNAADPNLLRIETADYSARFAPMMSM